MKAIVLRKSAFSEADWIVQFLLETGERASGFAAGARKSKRRFSHQFDPLGIYDLSWSSSSSVSQKKLARLKSCDLFDYAFGLSKDIERLTRWTTVLEWVASDESPQFSFERLLQVRRDLIQNDLASYFEFFLQELKTHGIYPQVEECTRCHRPFERSSHYAINLDEGGLLHPGCSSISANQTICFQTLTALKDFQQTSRLQAVPVSIELDRLLIPFLENQLGRQLKSHRFLTNLHSAASSAPPQ